MTSGLPDTRTDRLVAWPQTVFRADLCCDVADSPGLRESGWSHRFVPQTRQRR